MFRNIIKLVVIFTFLICPFAKAHRPIFTDEKGIDPQTAVKINNPEVSQVIYRSLSNQTPRLWLEIEAKKDFELFVQIGIPVIDKLKYFRPSFVVLGPGLPEISVPFTIPKNIGGKIFPTDKVEPEFFHEHFTKTDSWILRGETIVLPSSGKHYVVAYSPSKKKGKFWLSVGNQEKFGLLDWLSFWGWKDKIQKFHEVGMNKHKPKPMIIGDFSKPYNISKLGTEWRLVTDRVMGGLSDGKHGFGKDDRFGYINMKGNVSLKNNGGFVQIALPLVIDSKPFDAAGFSGVRFWAKGNSEKYYVHLRNSQTKMPWQYYSAEFNVSKNWQQIEILFEQFKPQALNSKMKIDRLSQIAIVGAKKAYKIDISVGPIEFYSNSLEKPSKYDHGNKKPKKENYSNRRNWIHRLCPL